VASSCEHGKEPSGSMKGREFFDCLFKYYLFERTLLNGVSYVPHSLKDFT
jgi:hypothetical protein